MQPALPLILALTIGLTGCARLANSPINPLNWFGASRSVALTPAEAAQRPLVPQERVAGTFDARLPIAQITDLAIERTSTGAILRATGVAPGQGHHNAQLVEVDRANGTVTYEFRVETPATPTAGAQTITVARALDAGDLAGVAVIRVLGQTNAREARR